MDTSVNTPRELLRTLPGDDVRQILGRFAGRFDLQMVVQSARAVARGPVARLVAAGARNSHEWTPENNRLLKAFVAAGAATGSLAGCLALSPTHGRGAQKQRDVIWTGQWRYSGYPSLSLTQIHNSLSFDARGGLGLKIYGLGRGEARPKRVWTSGARTNFELVAAAAPATMTRARIWARGHGTSRSKLRVFRSACVARAGRLGERRSY